MISLTPNEVNLEILSYVKLRDLAACCRVSKEWKEIAGSDKIWYDVVSRSFAFGKEWWEKNYGDVGKVPPLPKNIVQILKSPCPYWGFNWFQNIYNINICVAKTHILALVPKAVNEESFTSNHLVASKQENGPHILPWNFCTAHKSEGSYWILMTKDVVPGTFNEVRMKQKCCIEIEEGYHFAKPLDAAVGILASLSQKPLNNPFQEHSTVTESEPNLTVVFGPTSIDLKVLVWPKLSPVQENLGAVAVKRLS